MKKRAFLSLAGFVDQDRWLADADSALALENLYFNADFWLPAVLLRASRDVSVSVRLHSFTKHFKELVHISQYQSVSET